MRGKGRGEGEDRVRRGVGTVVRGREEERGKEEGRVRGGAEDWGGGYDSVGEGVIFKRLHLFKFSSCPYIVTK